MKKTILKKYAQLIARKGVNVQKGQPVVIRAGLDQPEFVEMVAEECYKAGASRVVVDWTYQPLTKLGVKYMKEKELGSVTSWEKARLEWRKDELPCRIYLMSDDPDGLKGVNRKKLAKSEQEKYRVIKPYVDATNGKEQWCIAAVPGVKWAKKVFPELSAKRAQEKLWEMILSASRVDDDPMKAWDEHNADLKKRCEYLNSLDIVSLEYHASNGTDFTVGMIPEAQFCGGGETTLGRGIFFDPNIPTEECFTSPKKGVAEGIVYASKPYSYKGQLIENAWFRFKEGKVVDCGASKNEDILKGMVAMDEGASYLGECALVPFDSPINNTGILFYNTLFDENACCHIAIGRGFIDVIKGYENRTLDEMRALGVNDSMIHEDFMIGTADLSITARLANGKKVEIFKNGNWAK